MSPSTKARDMRSAERLKFFTDAVVAIAMTLLILPLLESVAHASEHNLSTMDYLREQADQHFSFGMSFVIIAFFWISHERLFDYVGRWSGLLLTLNVTWLLSIVYLPVVTAMVGSMHTDPAQETLYMGMLFFSTVLMGLMNLVVRRDPSTWRNEGPGSAGLAEQVALGSLFVLALLLALTVPGLSYGSLSVLLVTNNLQKILVRKWKTP